MEVFLQQIFKNKNKIRKRLWYLCLYEIIKQFLLTLMPLVLGFFLSCAKIEIYIDFTKKFNVISETFAFRQKVPLI